LQATAELLFELLESRGGVPESLKAEILSITDTESLSKLFSLAVASQTVEEFIKRKDK